jgi:probable F420-dependent oxidoreductase
MRAIWDCWANDTKLDFRGDFYSHTLMTPFFNPGPNPYGRPTVLLAGVGPVMTAVAGEVADGFLCHGFTTERYLREVTLPALTKGRGGDLDGFTVSGAPFVATGRTEEELDAAKAGVRKQVAFYASTPAYRAVLELHGWGDLQDELHTMSVQNRWDEMGSAITDDILDAFAIVAEPSQVADLLLRRFGDVMDRATLYAPYDFDSALGRQIAADIRERSDQPAGR